MATIHALRWLCMTDPTRLIVPRGTRTLRYSLPAGLTLPFTNACSATWESLSSRTEVAVSLLVARSRISWQRLELSRIHTTKWRCLPRSARRYSAGATKIWYCFAALRSVTCGPRARVDSSRRVDRRTVMHIRPSRLYVDWRRPCHQRD